MLPLLLNFAIGLALAWLVFHLAVHLSFRAPRVREQGDPGDLNLPFETVAIPGRRHTPLFGWWLQADHSRQTVIVLHGWGSNAEQMLPLAAPLHDSGRNVLLFDARNHGRSPSAAFSSLPRFAQDLDSAIAWLQATRPSAAGSIVVMGHSVGAGAALFSASRRDDLAAVVSISAFAHPHWLTERHLRSAHIPPSGIRLVARYVEWLIGHRFDAIAPINTARAIRCPILLVHGDADTAVPLSDAHAIAQTGAKNALPLVIIPGGDHAATEHIKAHSRTLLDFLDKAEQPPPTMDSESAGRGQA